VKKESSTSTTISFSNNNSTGTTTLEIKSVKKEKTWDSETKKSKNKEFKGDEAKDVKNDENAKSIASGKTTNSSSKEDGKPSKQSNSKYKIPKEKQRRRDVSSSPASVVSGSLTPGGLNGTQTNGSTGSLHERLVPNAMDDEHVSVSSPASSSSIAQYDNGRGTARRRNSSDDESERSFASGSYRDTARNRDKSSRNRSSEVNSKPKRDTESIVNNKNKKDKDGDNFDYRSDKAYLSELISLQTKISQLKDRNILQKVVDEIEASAAYQLTDSTFDFDIMKLDRQTIGKLIKIVK
jgi:hypothetical protein